MQTLTPGNAKTMVRIFQVLAVERQAVTEAAGGHGGLELFPSSSEGKRL